MNWQLAARAHERQLRAQAALYSTALNGRQRSAHHLDELFHTLALQLQPDSFFEVGAFEATASQRLKAALPTCQVTAFEGSPVNYAHHMGRLDYRALGIMYRHAAVTDHSGTARIRVDRRDGAEIVAGNAASLLRRVDAANQEVHDVPCVRLDDVVSIGRCALWIDVEGAAGLVLAGSGDTLRRTDLLKIEVEDVTTWDGQLVGVDILRILLEHGLVPVACDAEYSEQHNIVAVSERAFGIPEINGIIDAHLYQQVHQFSEPSRLRRNTLLRRVARPIKRALTR